ncbi:MAG: hypothetical protein HY825_07220 [Acidobacteria bacterium]|nr:hypothetical protein [Acidobacteriota bacterium]
MRRLGPIPVLLGVLLAVIAARTGHVLWSAALAADALPQWDGAKYGVSGVRIADAIRRLDPLAAVAEIDRHELWPPLFALLEAPVFIAAGDEYRTPLVLTILAAVAVVLAAWWAGRQFDPDTGDLAGVLAAVALAASPMQHLFGALVMLEAPGALLLILALGSYARWRRTGRPSHARSAWIATLALFFLKYNYGISWLLALGLCESWHAAGSFAGVRTWFAARFERLRRRGARPWLLATAATGLLALVAFGSRSFDVGGVTRRDIPLGWPIWALYAAVVVRFAATPRKSLARLRTWLGGMDEAHRGLALWVGAPIALWMLVPRHTVGFFTALENRSDGPPLLSLDSLTFYPRAFVDGYAWAPWLGAAALALAALRICTLVRARPAVRPLLVALAVGLAAALAHPYKEPRFLFTVAPLLWLAAADAATTGARWLAPGRVARPAGVILAVLLAGGMSLLTPPVDVPRLRNGLAEHGVPRSVRPVLDAVDAGTATPGGTVVIGAWNGLSPALLEWHGRLRSAGPGDPAVARQPRRLVRPAEASRLAERAQESGVHRILVLDLVAGGDAWRPAWETETSWLGSARTALAHHPRWSEVSSIAFPESGYSLRVYRSTPD